MKRIGLFGGSFNPVHLGHLLVAWAAREELELDRVFFVPAAQSPFKMGEAALPGPERSRLLRLALVGMEWCEVDEQELQRGGVSYTIDTVRDYASRHPGAKLFYLIGADHISMLPKWRESPELARSIEFVAIPRPGQSIEAFPAPFRGQALKGFPLDISSSRIRERIRRGEGVDFLVPPPVVEAIRNNRLYL